MIKPNWFLTRLPIVVAAVAMTLGSCQKAPDDETSAETPVAPEATQPEIEFTETPQAQDQPQPADDLDALVDELFGDVESLPETQRKTLEAAIEKAVGNVDMSMLASSLAAQFGAQGVDLKQIGDATVTSSNVRVLSAEEAKELGIDLDALNLGESSPGQRIVSTQVFSIDGDSAGAGIGELIAQSPDQVPPPAISDTRTAGIELGPEASERFQQLLESGDAENLAIELSKIIQTGLDQAAVDIMIGPESQSSGDN